MVVVGRFVGAGVGRRVGRLLTLSSCRPSSMDVDGNGSVGVIGVVPGSLAGPLVVITFCRPPIASLLLFKEEEVPNIVGDTVGTEVVGGVVASAASEDDVDGISDTDDDQSVTVVYVLVATFFSSSDDDDVAVVVVVVAVLAIDFPFPFPSQYP